jgi:hypothetical protein
MKLPRLPSGLLVFLVFVAVVLVSLLAIFLLKDVPTSADACTRQCASIHRQGRLVPLYPLPQSLRTRGGGGPSRCECY